MSNQVNHGADRGLVLAIRAVTYLVYWVLVVVQLVLALGFVLQALGADPNNAFTAWIYRSLARALGPFQGIFPPIDLGGADGNVAASIDTSILFAMVCYGIVLVGLGALLSWLGRRLHGIDLRDNLRAQQDAYDDAVSTYQDPPDIVGSHGGATGGAS